MTPASSIRRISTLEELAELLVDTAARPIWLLKHSLVCPLSAEGLSEFERFITESGRAADAAIVEVQSAREVSNEIAERLDVRHETPQALLVLHGEARWHASHWSITAQALGKADEKLRSAADQTAV